MNYKLAQFFVAFNTCRNFIIEFTFQKIYHKDDVTEEDKKVFIDWLEENNLSISAGRGIIAFVDKDSQTPYMVQKHIDDIPTEILTRIKNDEKVDSDLRKDARIILDKRQQNKRDYTQHSMKCEFCSEPPCGFLAPDGTFYDSDWGEHESWANEHIRTNDWNALQEAFEIDGGGSYGKDFLICYKRYVLFDNPEGDGRITISYHTLTRKQKDYITDFLIKINDKKNLDELLVV